MGMPAILAAVAAGGALGAVGRFTVARWLHARLGPRFPWGTLAVNVSGSFLLGMLFPLLQFELPLSPLRAFITVGFAGAFTTFSTFALETVLLVRAGHPARAAAYVVGSCVAALVGLAAGLAVARLAL